MNNKPPTKLQVGRPKRVLNLNSSSKLIKYYITKKFGDE